MHRGSPPTGRERANTSEEGVGVSVLVHHEGIELVAGLEGNVLVLIRFRFVDVLFGVVLNVCRRY